MPQWPSSRGLTCSGRSGSRRSGLASRFAVISTTRLERHVDCALGRGHPCRATNPRLARHQGFHTAAFVAISGAILAFTWEGMRGRRGRVANEQPKSIAIAETIVYASNNQVCPLTPLAEQLGATSGSVTDIYLPAWISKRIPVFGGSVLLIGLVAQVVAWRRRPGVATSARDHDHFTRALAWRPLTRRCRGSAGERSDADATRGRSRRRPLTARHPGWPRPGRLPRSRNVARTPASRACRTIACAPAVRRSRSWSTRRAPPPGRWRLCCSTTLRTIRSAPSSLARLIASWQPHARPASGRRPTGSAAREALASSFISIGCGRRSRAAMGHPARIAGPGGPERLGTDARAATVTRMRGREDTEATTGRRRRPGCRDPGHRRPAVRGRCPAGDRGPGPAAGRGRTTRPSGSSTRMA